MPDKLRNFVSKTRKNLEDFKDTVDLKSRNKNLVKKVMPFIEKKKMEIGALFDKVKSKSKK